MMTIKLITERTRGLFLGARGISGIPGGRQWRLMGRRPPLAFHRETTKTRPTSSFFHINLYLFIIFFFFKDTPSSPPNRIHTQTYTL